MKEEKPSIKGPGRTTSRQVPWSRWKHEKKKRKKGFPGFHKEKREGKKRGLGQ
jgi:hypothetical protein